jgi:hypothetical protein
MRGARIGCYLFAAAFAEYYGLPMLSLRSCCYHDIAANAQGFKWDVPWFDEDNPKGFDYDGSLYLDRVHPNGLTGHKCATCRLLGLSFCTISHVGAVSEMLKDGLAPARDACAHARALKDTHGTCAHMARLLWQTMSAWQLLKPVCLPVQHPELVCCLCSILSLSVYQVSG